MAVKKPRLASGTAAAIILVALAAVSLISGCASNRPLVFATVDGTAITENDLGYALNISHRREDLASAKSLNIPSYVNGLIDDRLISDEAARMGMDESAEVTGAIQAFVLRESVVRLHGDEVLGRIRITDADVLAEYEKNYVLIGIIEVATEKDAKDVAERLKQGDGFRDLVKQFSTHYTKAKNGEMLLHLPRAPKDMTDILSSLSPGEVSRPTLVNEKYFLIKRFAPGDTSVDPFERSKGEIRTALQKQRQKDRETEYLKELRGMRKIEIDRELLAAIRQDLGKDELKKWNDDARPLVRIDSEMITVREFAQALDAELAKTKKKPRPNEEILNSMIDYKVVNQEALKRRYDVTSDLKFEVDRYRTYLLKNLFFKKVIMPQIVFDDQKLREYYRKNLARFTRPAVYRIQQIMLKTRKEADDAFESLRAGTDFLWLAKTRLGENDDVRMIEPGSLTKDRMAEPYRAVIDSLKQGDVSPVIEMGHSFAIIRLAGKTPDVIEEFDDVKAEASKAYAEAEFKRLLDQYLEKLRAEAKIEIYPEAADRFEARIK